MFNEDGTFNPDNWNGGDAIIRKFINHLYNEDTIIYECISYGDNSYDLICSLVWHDDHQYININVISNNHDTVDHVFFRIYKVRGGTEMARYNGQNMNIDQYLLLLNLIQTAGFDFNLG